MSRGRKSSAAGTPATVALAQAGVDFTLHGYDHDHRAESYGREAAEELGIDPSRVFKTLVADVDSRLVVGIVPVTHQLSLKALALAVGGKRARMADPRVAERKTGYVIGGISPLGQKTRLDTVLDASADEHATVFVSGGRRGLDIEIAPDALRALTNAQTAPIAD